MPKTNFSIYMTLTFFLLCMVFWFQTDAIKSGLSHPVGIPVQTDDEIDRLLLQAMLAKHKKPEEKQQPKETWNSSDSLIDDNVDAEDWMDTKPAVVSSRPVTELKKTV